MCHYRPFPSKLAYKGVAQAHPCLLPRSLYVFTIVLLWTSKWNGIPLLFLPFWNEVRNAERLIYSLYFCLISYNILYLIFFLRWSTTKLVLLRILINYNWLARHLLQRYTVRCIFKKKQNQFSVLSIFFNLEHIQ